MARNEVAEKIEGLITSEISGWKEPEVVYLFVELRKLLDHAREETQINSPHLRFYCDWVVHISKDRIDPVTLEVIRNMEAGINKQIKTPYLNLGEEAIDFAYFRSLHKELLGLLIAESLSIAKIEQEAAWTKIVNVLVKVLENQPLNIAASHGLNLKRLIFIPSAPQVVIMHIDFNVPVVGKDGIAYPYYVLKNAY